MTATKAIGGTGPVNWNTSKVYADAKSGAIQGHTVTLGEPNAPAKHGGFFKAVGDFFTKQLPVAFSAGKHAFLSLLTREQADEGSEAPTVKRPPTSAPPPPNAKSILDMEHPGDWYNSSKNYPTPDADTLLASLAAYLPHYLAKETNLNGILRANNTASRTATLQGIGALRSHTTNVVREAYKDSEMLGFLEKSYTEGRNYQIGRPETAEAKERAEKAVKKAEEVVAILLGSLDDGKAVAQAVQRASVEHCNALAIGFDAIDKTFENEDDREKAKSGLCADFIALRVVSPGITDATVGQDPTVRRNILEFSKFFQMTVNGVDIATVGNDKEAPHPAVIAYVKKNNVDNKFKKMARQFGEAMVTRSDPEAVKAAKEKSAAIVAEFNRVHNNEGSSTGDQGGASTVTEGSSTGNTNN